MKKLEDYKGQKIAIHFPTYELWLRRKEINPSDDCGDYWTSNDYKKGVYYLPFFYTNTGMCSKLEGLKGYTILPATDFLEEEFIYGQEYEFSNDNKEWHKRIFLCKTPNNIFISWNKKTNNDWNYKYARKINTERNEAITTIKELVSKFSINQNEVF